MDYDQASGFKTLPAIAPASYTTDQTSAALNTASHAYKALTAAIYVGFGGITFDADNRIDFEVTHSDDNDTYTAVTDDDVVIPLRRSLARVVSSSRSSLRMQRLNGWWSATGARNSTSKSKRTSWARTAPGPSSV